MAINTAIGYFTNGSSPSTDTNFGPYTTGSCFKILRARVKGQHTLHSQDLTDPFTFVEVLVYGIQAVPTGVSPKDLVTDPSDPAFLAIEHDHATSGSVVWSPSTDTAVYGNSLGFEIGYQGQKPNTSGGAVDFYFGFASQFGGPATWLMSGSIELWWIS